MGFSYIKESDIENSLREFSKGHTYSLFKLALSSIYNDRELLLEPGFILNIFKTIKSEEDIKDFTELLKDKRIDFSAPYTENDPKNLETFNSFWNDKISFPCPLIFALIPHLNDSQVSNLIRDNSMYRLGDNPEVKSNSANLTLSLFENGYHETLLALKEECYFIDTTSLNFYEKKKFEGFDEECCLEDVLFTHVLKKPELIDVFSRISYSSINSICDRWLNHHLEQDRKDNVLIQNFLDNVFNKLDNDGKENVISYMLYKTNDLDFLQDALKKYGCDNISSYKPNKYPIWIRSDEHKNKSIYRKFLRNGIDLFEHYKEGNRVFISTMLNGLNRRKDFKTILEEQKIDYKYFINELLKERTDSLGKTYNNFQLCLATGESAIIDHFNLKLDDLVGYSKKFKSERYEKLKIQEKLNLIEEVISKTFLAPAYIPEGIYYKNHIEKAKIGFNLFMNTQYGMSEKPHLISEHLSLLEQVDIKKYDYRTQYFEIVSQILEPYYSRHMDIESDYYKTCMKMIDYVATDKNLDWKTLSELLNSESYEKNKENFSEGAKNALNYLQNICLSHTLSRSPIIEKKKIKI